MIGDEVNPAPTPFAELNGLLLEIAAHAQRVFLDDLVGVYLQGSFALGAADLHSDCDFLVVVHAPVTAAQEAHVRRLHDDIPTRSGHWVHHLEGSYPVAAELRTLDGSGRPWLYIDHGWREMQWDVHCNNEVARWILRHHGVRVIGPPPEQLVDPIPPAVMRDGARKAIPTAISDIEGWVSLDQAWGQRYAVVMMCRLLYTLETAEVASKRAAITWAREHVGREWHSLLTRAMEGRTRGWDPDDRALPDEVTQTRAFADYVAGRSLSGPSA
ncbi:MAG: hypothetical protein QOK42_1018 [Frankiaceae bacterium]|nr:hypothetical protein [Frankiaceae bacterium]